jgi:glycerate 2-kinase
VLAGRVDAGRREAAAIGVTEAYALVEHFGSVQRAMEQPADGLRALGQRLARQWSR